MEKEDSFLNRFWLGAIRRYLLASLILHLVWEFAHMPLYTLWETGTTGEIIFAAIHCTLGDVLIALSVLIAALIVIGNKHWPRQSFVSVYVFALLLGIFYTAVSEWLNIDVRKSWAYTDSMPVIPLIGMGLSPLMQWIFVPTIAAFWAQESSDKFPQ